MNREQRSTTEYVAELRRGFDQSFAVSPSTTDDDVRDLLEVRLAETPYVIRLADIGGLIPIRPITPLPTEVPALLGLAVHRRSVLPVYDLRALLGHRSEARPRWVIVAASRFAGFAFDQFVGHARVRQDSLVPCDQAGVAAAHVREIVEASGFVRPVISLASVLEAITTRIPAVQKE